MEVERPRSKPETNNRQELSSAFPNRIERFDQNFIGRLRSEIAFAVNTDTHGVGVHVAVPDHEHRVHFHPLGVCNLGFDMVATAVELGANLMGAQFVEFNNHAAGVRQKRSYFTLLSNSLTVVRHGNSSPK